MIYLNEIFIHPDRSLLVIGQPQWHHAHEMNENIYSGKIYRTGGDAIGANAPA